MTTTGYFRNNTEILEWFNESSAESSATALEPIEKGGSVRRYYRARNAHRASLGIIMEYSDEKLENTYFFAIAEFLAGLGVPVPRVQRHDPERRLAWIEDFGSMDLYALKGRGDDKLIDAYTRVIDAISPLWRDGHARWQRAGGPVLMEGFGPQLYLWERDHFFDQCIARLAGPVDETHRAALHLEARSMQSLLMAQPAALVHRDLQSHNIILRDRADSGAPGFIDFQGMREGTWFYDLASLLNDPYMELSDPVRRAVLRHARQLMDWSAGEEAFMDVFEAATAQRLMQALGAYGYLGMVLGKREFLGWINPARQTLGEVAKRRGWTTLSDLLQRLPGSIPQRA